MKTGKYNFLELTDNKKSPQGLVLILLGLFLGVIIGERLLNFSSMMFWVSLLAAIYAACWSFFIGRFKEFLKHMKAYGKNIIEVKNEVVFFLCVGFIGVVLANTPLQGIIECFFTSFLGCSTFIVVELIILVTVLLAVLGVHHVITITALGLSLKAEVLGLSDMGYSLTLIGAFAISMIASPFAPFNIISAGLFDESSFMISLGYNRVFALVLIPLTGAFVIAVNYFS